MALHKTNSIRGFDHIDSGYVTLRDYLFYNDILYHGSLIEKITQSFRMLDLTNGKPGVVTQELFLEFMQKYMLCRSELLQTKFKITDQIMLVFLDNFQEIAGDKDSFCLEDFIVAKIKNPSFLSVLEDFEESQRQQGSKVDYLQFKNYHEQVLQQFGFLEKQIGKAKDDIVDPAELQRNQDLILSIKEAVASINHRFEEMNIKQATGATKKLL